MSYYLWEMRPYFRQVAGQMVLGSLAGIMMNTAVVLPAILLGRAIVAALAFGRGDVGSGNSPLHNAIGHFLQTTQAECQGDKYA